MSDTAAESGSARTRRALPITLVVIATVLAFVSVFAIWAKRQLLETDTWTTTSSRLLENQDIRDAVADYLVSQLYANVDVEGQLSKALPSNLKPLAGPASGGLRELALRISEQALAQPKVQGLWEDANRKAHEEFLAVIDNKNDAISTSNGNVVLDLGTILTQVADQVGIGGNLASKLPPDAAQIRIMRSDDLAAAQTGVRVLRTLAWLLAALAIVLYGVAIYVAGERRRQTLRSVGLAFAAVGVLVLFAHGIAGDYVVGALTTTATSEPAAQAAWSIGTTELVEIAQALILYGVVIVLAAWLAGPTASATWIRRGLTPYFRQPRIAYGALGVLLVLVLWWGPTDGTRRLLPSLLLIALAGPRHRGDAAADDPRVSRPRDDGVRGGHRPADGDPDARGAAAADRLEGGRAGRGIGGRGARRPARAPRRPPRLRRPLGRGVRRREAADPRVQ